MFLRHFGFLVLFACIAAGCSCGMSHTRPPLADTGPPPVMGDAGVPGADTGMYVWPDATPVADSGTDAGTAVTTALRIVFDGPAESIYLRGSRDVVMYRFTLTAYEDVEIRRFLRILYSAPDGPDGENLVIGSAGTVYFQDQKLTDADTGETLMVPRAGDSPVYGDFEGSFIVRAGESRHLNITMDLSDTEDAFGEFFGDGNNRYSVAVGSVPDDLFFPLDGVRRVSDGSFVEPEAIENNDRIEGNWMTIVDAGFTVHMAATPALTNAVKRQPLIPSVGLVFSASTSSDILIRSVRLTGVGNLDGTDDVSELNDVITMCALFDGDVQVGLAQAPDAVTGSMNITAVNVTVPAGSSVTLVARCTADSVVAGEYDIYSIGIADASHVVAERLDGVSTTSVLDSRLQNNAATTLGNFVIVRDHGDITVATDNLRQSTILVAGPDVWQNMAQFKLTAQYEDIELERVRVTSRGEAASFNMIAIASDGVVLGTGVLPAGTDSERDVVFTDAYRIPRDGSRTIQIWARISPVVSSAEVGGATTGVARSGNRIRLGLAADVETGDWDVNYVGMLNMRFVGTVSGDLLYADGPEVVGNEFVVRRTKPTFTRLTLSTTNIVNGVDQDLYRFQISADSAGSVGLMGFAFRVDRPATTTVGLRIRRGATEIPAISTAWPDGVVAFQFYSEETITGSGNVYTVHGVLDGFAIGETFSIAPYRDLDSAAAVTGYVADDRLRLDTGSALLRTGILWSDMSEVPHSWTTRALGGSFDWTGDTLVEDLTQTQFLSR